MGEIDTGNKFFVSRGGPGFSEISFTVPPPRKFSRKDALNMAAWLVMLAQEEEGEFDKLLDIIRGM